MKHDAGHPSVSRRVLIPVETPWVDAPDELGYGLSILLTNTAYASVEGRELLQLYSLQVHSDTTGTVYARRSRDNGASWDAPEVVHRPHPGSRGVHRWGEACLFLDEETDRLLHVFNDQHYPAGTFSGPAKRYTRIMLRHSDDGGRSFSAPAPLVVRGGDATRWAPGTVYGENCMQLSFCAPIRLGDGTLLLPACRIPLGSDYRDFPAIGWEAGCFRGTRRAGELQWELGGMLAIDAGSSTRGLDEPTVAELVDGRIMMIMRGSNHRAPHLPGRKWLALSPDGGRTWDRPRPFGYVDGTPFYSPAAGSRLVRSSATGRLYWIGNILDANPDGNRPRHPLQIAEVDEAMPALRRETVYAIDDCGPGDSPWLQLSNFRVHEDRATGEFVVILARLQQHGEQDHTSPAYEYRIRV